MTTTTNHRRPTSYNAIERDTRIDSSHNPSHSDELTGFLTKDNDDPHINKIEKSNNNNNRRNRTTVFHIMLVFLTCSSITLMAVAASGGSLEDVSDWFEHNWELGIRGRIAQRIADRSPINIVSSPQPETHPTIEAQDHKPEVMPPMLGSSNHTHFHHLPEEGCETTVMLIRHCEKSNLKSHCNFVGYERATYLSTVFGERWPLPVKVYALETTRKNHENLREIETVKLVAQKAGVEIDTGYGTSHTSKLANKLIRTVKSGEMCGKMILISWKHSDLPKLAHHLGCGPMEGCPRDYRGAQFDQVWEIKYVFRSFLQTIGTSKERTESSKKMIDQHWDVYGSVQYENFDPLEFSMKAGDYPEHGTSHGARWNAKPHIEFYG